MQVILYVSVLVYTGIRFFIVTCVLYSRLTETKADNELYSYSIEFPNHLFYKLSLLVHVYDLISRFHRTIIISGMRHNIHEPDVIQKFKSFSFYGDTKISNILFMQGAQIVHSMLMLN